MSEKRKSTAARFPWRRVVRGAALVLLAFGAATQAGWHGVDLGLVALMLLAAAAFLAPRATADGSRALPPLPAGAVGVLAALAAAWGVAGYGMPGWRQLVQMALLLGLGAATGRGLSARERALFGRILALAFAASLLAAVGQLLAPQVAGRALAACYGAPWAAGGDGPELGEEWATGFMASHALYALFMCATLPFALGELAKHRRPVFWAGSVALVVLLAQTLFLPGMLILAGVVLALFGALCPARLRARQAVWLPALLAVFLVLSAGLRLFGPANAPSPWTHLRLFSDVPGMDRRPTRLVLETAAAFETAPARPFGWGPGSYRTSIGRARIEAELPRPVENRVRRDSNSQYIVLLVECGGVAMLSLVFLMVGALGGALRAVWDKRLGKKQAPLAAAWVATLAALLLGGCFGLFLVRGPGWAFSVLIGAALGEPTARKRRKRRRLARTRTWLAQGLLVAAAAAAPLLFAAPTPVPAPMNTLAPPHVKTGAPEADVLLIEAEDCVRHDSNLVVRLANDAGGNRILSVPAGAGHQAGEAAYEMLVPAPGRYKLWLRVLWEGACSNSIQFRLGDGRAAELQDPIFGRWHWVDVAAEHAFDLPAGPVRFSLLATEDGVHIDQIAFFSDLDAVPVGILTADADACPAAMPCDAPAPASGTAPDDGEWPRDAPFDKYAEE